MSEQPNIESCLNAYRRCLTAIASKVGQWEAQVALSVLDGVERGPLNRHALFAVMEASLGVDDLELEALQDSTEAWLSLSAPHEFEHYLDFRLRTEYQEVADKHVWRQQMALCDWQVIVGSFTQVAAVSLRHKAVASLLMMPDASSHLAMTQYAYTDTGLGQAVLAAISASSQPHEQYLSALNDSPLNQLPQVQEYLRARECSEEQLALWMTAPAKTAWSFH